jgi:hypothetical protein
MILPLNGIRIWCPAFATPSYAAGFLAANLDEIENVAVPRRRDPVTGLRSLG